MIEPRCPNCEALLQPQHESDLVTRELISRSTIAEMMGLTIDAIKWHRTYGKMPEADYVVDNKPLWFRDTINAWIETRRQYKRS